MAIAKRGAFGGRVLVEPLDSIRWRLAEPIHYTGEKQQFIIPAGYVTDFATIPRVAVWLIPRFGAWGKAAILHDWLLSELVRHATLSSVDADGLFRRVLREEGVPPYRRSLMWTGVRWAAAFSPYRRAGWWKTFPEVLLYTIIFLLTILPPLAMIVVALALVAHGIVETIASTFSRRDETTSGSLST